MCGFAHVLSLDIISSKRRGGLLLPHGGTDGTEHPENYGSGPRRMTPWSGDDCKG